MADVTPLLALGAGMLAFFAPCILPMVPAFLGFIAGGAQVGNAAQPVRRGVRVGRTLAFVFGFGISFTVLGYFIATAGQSLSLVVAQRWLRWIGGGLIILFGLAMTGLLRPQWMDRDLRFHGKLPKWAGPTLGPVILGAAFGLGWSPCVGPILATILIQASLTGAGLQGAFLLGLFAIGLGIPFLIVGLVADRATATLRRFAKAAHVVEVVGGIMLILLGVFIFTGAASRFLYFFVR